VSAVVIETPPCAVCGQFRTGQRARHHLTHGVSLWLCDAHRADAYLSRDGGRDFVARLSAVWAASDGLTSRRRKALRAHLRAVVGVPAARELPGSYSWPALRREAERRFAAGEAPAKVIADLRRTYADGPSIVPSVRTMRRWFTQARWLVAPPRTRANARHAPRPRVGPLTPGEQMVNLLLTGYGNWPRDDGPRQRGP
jgi:hypothetical protein